MWKKVFLALFRIAAIMLLAGFLGGTLIRVAPGFAFDERQLNSSLSAQSIQAIRQARLADADILHYYVRYLGAFTHGDMGMSQTLNQPVRDLLRDRLPATLRNLAWAVGLAWVLGLALAAASQLTGSRVMTFIGEGLSGTFISTPAAVLALVFLLLRFPPQFAPALLVFPKIYRYCHNLLRQSYALPHVLTARARGASGLRVLIWHVLPTMLPQVLALFGVSVSLALTALLPIEVICDVAGIGQLAWQAAEGRDLTLLVGLTLVVTLLSVSANTFSDLARETLLRGKA
ncbi:MAG TPA: ABC transporter permease [Verrucomicrobiae bacterium]|jgi:peptide/nickel transport system permease protein|nr:ABC transporter permease [Verrucomicrobiae bacterium]